MRLFYISNARIPTEKAHGIQIMKMCEAFSHNAAEVILVHPYRVQSKEMEDVTDIWDYYGVEEKFRIICLPCIDLAVILKILPKFFEKPWFLIQSLSYAVVAFLWLLFQKLNYNDIIYSRDQFSLVLILAFKRFIRVPIFYEAHVFPQSKKKLAIFLFSRVDGLIVITKKLKEFYIKAGVPVEKVFVAPDGVDLKMFSTNYSKEVARRKLGLPLDRRLILYTGQLFTWKGVYTLAKSGNFINKNGNIIIVGGMVEDVKELHRYLIEENIWNVELKGFVRPSLVFLYIQAADVLVLPNSAHEEISRNFTSPLKMFEYMASKRPIVASDLPSIREILHDDENAILVEPDNPKALADGIIRVLEDREVAFRISQQAYSDVQHFSWDERSKRIIKFISGQSRNYSIPKDNP